MSEATSNGNGQTTQQARRRARRAYLEAVMELRQSRVRRLCEHYLDSDNDWSSSELWDRTRGEYRYSLPSQPGDRQAGADWPLWRNQTDLGRILQKARVVSEVNSYAKGFRENYVNHVVGKGCKYQVVSKEGTPDADPSTPGQQDAAALAAYVARCQDEVDRFLKSNRWNGVVDPRGPLVFTGSREREIVDRTLSDGEAILRFHVVSNRLVVRFIEPEQVKDPPTATHADGWSYGFRHQVGSDDAGVPLEDVETIEAMFVYWKDPTAINLTTPANQFGEEIPAGEFLHCKGPNTRSTVKRGISFFSFDVAASFERARLLQRNLSIGACVRAGIAEHWEHETGTEAEVSNFAQGQREGYTDRTKDDGSSETENYERRYPGMIRRTPKGITQVFPGLDNTPAYMQGVQGDLQQSVAGKCAPLYWAADTSGGTYAGLKEAGAPAVKMAEAQQTYFTAVFARVLWKALEIAVAAERLEDWLHLIDLQVEPPTVYQRDRLQVAQESQILNMLGALSPQTICMEAGRDYEVEAANIEKHQDRFGQMGTPLGMPGADGQLPGMPGMPGPPKIPDTHGMGDDAGGALHEGRNSPAARPFSDSLSEGAGTCKPGETAAKTGCVPGSGGEGGGAEKVFVSPEGDRVKMTDEQWKSFKVSRNIAYKDAATRFGLKTDVELQRDLQERGIRALGNTKWDMVKALATEEAARLVPADVEKVKAFQQSIKDRGKLGESLIAAESARYDSCVRQVAAKGDADNPHAVCKAALGECSEADCPCPACAAKRGAQPLLEPAGTCKQGERSDLTGCAPATKDAAPQSDESSLDKLKPTRIKDPAGDEFLSEWTGEGGGAAEYAKQKAAGEKWVQGGKNPGIDAVYQDTQKKLAAAGVTEVKAYRGIRLPADHPLVADIKAGKVKPPAEVDIKGTTFASWSTDQGAASTFAKKAAASLSQEKGNHVGLVLERVIAAKDVVSGHGLHEGFIPQEKEVLARAGGSYKLRLLAVH